MTEIHAIDELGRDVPVEQPWKAHGITGVGPKPGLIDMFSGALVIVGCSPLVWEELKLYFDRLTPQERKTTTVMAVNDIGMYLPVVHHWVSLHDDILILQHEIRSRIPRPEARYLHGSTVSHLGRTSRTAGAKRVLWPAQIYARKDLDYVEVNFWYLKFPSCRLSGQFAVLLGVLMGYDPITLVGIPADHTGKLMTGVSTNGGHGGTRQNQSWLQMIERVPELKLKVRSVSGRTREWLGSPDDG